MSHKRLIAVGEKLKAARNEQGLSLRELAGRAGVSASLLSQIECGKVMPSAASLFQVATALELPVHAFFPQGDEHMQGAGDSIPGKDVGEMVGKNRLVAESRPTYAAMESRSLALSPSTQPEISAQPGPVVRPETRMVIELMGGATWARLTPGAEEGMEFLEITYEPGYSSGAEMLYHTGREFGYVIEGELLLELGFERYQMKAGESIIFDSTIPHRCTNTSTRTTRAIWVRFTPARTA
jgi:transcriptional regulator with XRE-family HTH domain